MFCVEKYRNVETYCYICSRIHYVDMEQVGNMKFIDFEETLDRNTSAPKRDAFEIGVDDAVQAYNFGEAPP